MFCFGFLCVVLWSQLATLVFFFHGWEKIFPSWVGELGARVPSEVVVVVSVQVLTPSTIGGEMKEP